MRTDGKYVINGTLTKLDGTPLPPNEPIIIFRSKDKLLVPLLEHYLELCRNAGSPEEHLTPLQQRIDEIKSWQVANTDKLKVPD